MLGSSRAAILLVFAAFGACVGAHLGAIPVIFKNASLTDVFFGQAQSLIMLFSMGAMLLGGYLGRLFDHRQLLLVFLPLLAGSLFYALIVQSPSTYVVSCIFFAGLLSMIDIHMNAEGAIIEEELKRPVYSSFHAAVSAAMAVAGVLSSFLSVKFGAWASGIVAMLLCIWAAIEVARLVQSRALVEHEEKKSFSTLPFGKLLIVGSAIGLGGLCELFAVLYAGQLLVKLEPALAEYSGLGVAFYAGCMAVVRIFGDRLRATFGEAKCLGVSVSLAILGFFALSFAPGFWTSVAAYAAIGTGISFLSPILFPLAGRLAPAQRSSAMSVAFAVANLYRFIAPAGVGLLVAAYGLSIVFAVCVVLAIGALVLAQWILAITRSTKGAAIAAPRQLDDVRV